MTFGKPLGPQPWEVVRSKLDQAMPFANMRGTPYYRDAVWSSSRKRNIPAATPRCATR